MIENIHSGNAKEYGVLIPEAVRKLSSVVIRTHDLTKPDEWVENWCLYASKRTKKPIGMMPGNIGSGSLIMILECAGISAKHEPSW